MRATFDSLPTIDLSKVRFILLLTSQSPCPTGALHIQEPFRFNRLNYIINLHSLIVFLRSVLVQHLAFICDISTVDEDGKMASCSLRVPFPQLKEHRLLHEKYQGERRKSGEVRNENLSPTIEKPKESPKRKRSTSNEGQERGVTMTIAQFVSMERRDETAHNPRSFCSTADVLPRKLYSEEDEFAQGIHKYLQESRNIKPRPENNATMSPSSIGTMSSSEQDPPQIVGSPNRTMTQPPSSPSVTPSKKPRVQPSPISPKSHSANKNDIRITTDAIDRNSSPYSSPSKIFRVGGHHD